MKENRIRNIIYLKVFLIHCFHLLLLLILNKISKSEMMFIKISRDKQNITKNVYILQEKHI